jgi:uncharacterized membrane protein YfcA
MHRSQPQAFLGGAAIGTLGGLIGLGGAEFRLPLLIGPFGFSSLEARACQQRCDLVIGLAVVVLVFEGLEGRLDVVLH